MVAIAVNVAIGAVVCYCMVVVLQLLVFLLLVAEMLFVLLSMVLLAVNYWLLLLLLVASGVSGVGSVCGDDCVIAVIVFVSGK